MNGNGATNESPGLKVAVHAERAEGYAVGERSDEYHGKPASKLIKVTGKGSISSEEKVNVLQEGKNIGLLLDMPLDVILAVFGHLSLADLVTLTRTSKGLRNTLMVPHLSIWKVVREKHDVPQPPVDFSEPKWAALLFGGSHCWNCGAQDVKVVDFYLRRRTCNECRRHNYIVESRVPHMFPKHHKLLLDLVPYSDGKGCNYQNPSSSKFFWKADIRKVLRQMNAMNSTEQKFLAFCKERVAFVASTRENGAACLEWVKRERRAESKLKKKAPKTSIRQKLIDLGYDERDIAKFNSSYHGPASKAVTDGAWKQISSKVKNYVNDAQKDRRREEVWEHRPHLLIALVNDHTRNLLPSARQRYPIWREISTLPVFQQIYHSDPDIELTEESFKDAFDRLPGLVETWLEGKKSVLREQIRKWLSLSKSSTSASEAQSPVLAANDPVDLATSVFCCGTSYCANDISAWASCYNRFFGWDAAVYHTCRRDLRDLDLDWRDHDYCYRNDVNCNDLSLQTPSTTIIFDSQGATYAAQMVEMVGLDPLSATVDDMDKQAQHFFCSGCHGSRRKVYTWRTAVAHQLRAPHDKATISWRILTPSEMASVRFPINPSDRIDQWTCNLCLLHYDAQMSKTDVLNHIAEKHAIAFPQESIHYWFLGAHQVRSLPYWQLGGNPSILIKQDPCRSVQDRSRDLRCLHCPAGRASERLFPFKSLRAHIIGIHGIAEPMYGDDYILG